MGRLLSTDILKMALSAAWIMLVSLVFQQFAAGRFEARSNSEMAERARSIRQQVATFRDGLNGPQDDRLVAAMDTSKLDRESLNQLRARDGVLEVTSGALPDTRRAADFIDAAVKRIGVDHVGLSSALYEQEGFSITLELLRRGYTQEDLFKLLGGNAQRVMSAPLQPAPPHDGSNIVGRSSK
jgi:hypothetical protein